MFADIVTSMRRHLKNLLIPHPGNNHRPHLLREAGALFLGTIIVLLFGFSVFRGLVINKTAHYLGSVLPAVLVDLTNEDRLADGLGELKVNPVLEEAARLKAQNMADNHYFAHVSPDGLDPWYWFYRAGYTFTDAGENLAVNFTDSSDVEKAWMNSPGHRANILNGKYTEIGIAAVKGTYKGKTAIFVVQLFGNPAKTVTALAPKPEPETATAPVKQPTVAGASAETVQAATPIAQAVTPSAPPTKLVKEGTTAHVEGAIEPAPAQGKPAAQVSPLTTMTAEPRATVSWAYLMIGLLISFVIMLMVYKQVHMWHPHSIVYGCALLALITLLSYFNFLLLSSNLVIV